MEEMRDNLIVVNLRNPSEPRYDFSYEEVINDAVLFFDISIV